MGTKHELHLACEPPFTNRPGGLPVLEALGIDFAVRRGHGAGLTRRSPRRTAKTNLANARKSAGVFGPIALALARGEHPAMRQITTSLAGGIGFVLVSGSAAAGTLTVGPGKQYAAPCAAAAAANDGDLIEIDAAGNYDGDVCAIGKNNLTLRGVGGRAKIDAAGNNAQGKAIWVITGNDVTVENVELSGAAVVDKNGAGIRQEGTNLTVRGCYFHDNEDGILAGDKAGSQILIEYTEFDHNGAGDGYSHNLYINHVDKLTFQYNWSHSAQIGHLLKSRAAETYVLYSRMTGESDGTESYEIDVPNGGKTYVIGNLVEQGPNTDNPSMLAYQEEGANAANPSHELFVVNNTFVNDKGSGTFVNVGGSVSTPAVIKNNIFFGGGTVTNQGGATLANNDSGSTSCLVDAANFDYHLVAGSPCVDAGADPGTGAGFSLLPAFHYLHPTAKENRTSVGTIDVGAYELGGGSAGSGGAAGSGNGGSAGSSSGGASSGGASSGGASSGGAPSGGGGAPSGGASSGGASASTGGAKSASSGDDGGCGCRAAGGGAPGRGVFALAAAALLLIRTRRTTRTRDCASMR
jgi:MYXO-CTERM domain-containing protein